MRIAICDDDKGCCKQLKLWVEEQNLEAQVYYTTEDLLRDMKSGIIYDIIFLDIDFKGLSGVEAGKEIRRFVRRDGINIAFISARQEYAMKLFEIEPLNFHVKPLKQEKILADIEKIRHRVQENQICLSYKASSGIQRKVELRDILYIGTKRGMLVVHMVDGQVDAFTGLLSRIDETLQTDIGCQCHRSHWANFSYVTSYVNQKLYLYDGTEIPVGREYKEKVKAKWIRYKRGER